MSNMKRKLVYITEVCMNLKPNKKRCGRAVQYRVWGWDHHASYRQAINKCRWCQLSEKYEKKP